MLCVCVSEDWEEGPFIYLLLSMLSPAMLRGSGTDPDFHKQKGALSFRNQQMVSADSPSQCQILTKLSQEPSRLQEQPFEGLGRLQC